MTIAYLNYPQSNKNIHRDGACNHPDKHHSTEQRKIDVTSTNASDVIKQFQNNEIDFAAKAGKNDLLLKLDFNNESFEIAFVKFLTECLSKRYKPFGNKEVTFCSGCFPNNQYEKPTQTP